LDRLLDDLERGADRPRRERLPARIECGVSAIDRLLGGVPTGRVTLITSDQDVLVDAIAASLVLESPHRVVLAMEERPRAARILVSALARVPLALLESGNLDDIERARVSEACGLLAERQETFTPDRSIFISASTSPHGVVRAAQSADADLCIVVRPERLTDGVLGDAVVDLGDAMQHQAFAMVLVTAVDSDRSDAVIVSDDDRGRSVTLTAPDPADLLRRTHASVDIMCRVFQT
jgi:hypothetical protein